jgi:hypothetical protein
MNAVGRYYIGSAGEGYFAGTERLNLSSPTIAS